MNRSELLREVLLGQLLIVGEFRDAHAALDGYVGRNRELTKSAEQVEVDSQMVSYDQMNRSPDDPVSHEGRFKILRDRLSKFRPS